jgi:hypothetical protein
VCSNCLKYELECEYPPEKPTSSRGSSPKLVPLKRITSNDNNSSPSPPKCKCQRLEETGVLPRRASEATGGVLFGEQNAHSLMDPQFLQSMALQPNTITTSADRLLELKLMHRKYAIFIQPFLQNICSISPTLLRQSSSHLASWKMRNFWP